MKKALLSTLILALVFTFFACSGAKKGKSLVSVGGETITNEDLELLGRINPRINAQLATEFGKKKILDNLVEQELLYQASVKEGLDRDSTVKDKIDIYRRVIISQAYLDKELQESARKHYDENKSDFEKLQLSHILVKFKKDEKDKTTERSEKGALDLANKIKKRITGGEDFAKVAQEVSEDRLTNKRGGDLGFTSKGEQRLTRRGYAPLLEKAFTMKVGDVTGPIKTKGGYHIITVTKAAELQPYDEVSQGILFKIRNDTKKKLLTDLKETYKVEFAKVETPKAPQTKVVPTEKPTAAKPVEVTPKGTETK